MPPAPATATADRRPTLVAARPRTAARRWLVAVAVVVVFTTSSLAIRVANVAADGVPPSTFPTTTFSGRGYGPGVGMSQYGARGRALARQLAPQILAHYYAGTTLGSRSAATIVRVLLLTGFQGTAAKPLTIVGLGGAWTIDGIAKTFPAGATLALVPTAAGATTWKATVTAATGVVLHAATLTGYQFVRPAASATRLQL
ncbi:MAG: stage sporulation protein, partial [Chloroflexota bacterium]|nr:stage sporulation protein [Chloroflexota bacterium]